MKAMVPALLALVVMCCSCSRQNTAEIPGPWRLKDVALMDMAPAGGGKMTVSLFSANRKPRYLWMTLSFEEKPSRRDLQKFAILDESGDRAYGSSVHSSIENPAGIILVFESQTGWDTKIKLTLSGMSHEVPFKTPRKTSK